MISRDLPVVSILYIGFEIDGLRKVEFRDQYGRGMFGFMANREMVRQMSGGLIHIQALSNNELSVYLIQPRIKEVNHG